MFRDMQIILRPLWYAHITLGTTHILRNHFVEGGEGVRGSKTSKNDQKCLKMSKNVQKCPKMSKNVQKCPKMSKKCPGNVQEMSKKCPNNVQTMSKNFPKNVQKCTK